MVITEYIEIIFMNWLELSPSERPTLLPGEMWVFIINGIVEAVDFLCPCGCGRECYTPVVSKGQPRDHHSANVWTYEPGPTLAPSIRFLTDCRTHFNITNGKVIMHGDSGK